MTNSDFPRRRAALGLGNVVAALVGACLLPWEALGQQTTISPEVLKVARKVNRPPNSERLLHSLHPALHSMPLCCAVLCPFPLRTVTQ